MNVHVLTRVSALLRLRSENGTCANETQFVKSICLPEGPFPDGSNCTISGWGATENCKPELILLPTYQFQCFLLFPAHDGAFH